jgi:hypothetical protein|nr:MAG: hypothetical protein DIU57_05920 [Pseudomonadota bacterium]
MLGRLVLILLQLAIGWFGAPQVLRYVPVGGDAQMFVYAVAAAIIVWLVGVIGAQILKDVPTPSAGTLAAALIGGLIGAAIVVFKLNQMIPVSVPPNLWPLGLAVLGYALKK